MASNHAKDPTKKYMAEVVAAVAVVYFLFGGYAWSPATWALFAIVGIWIILKNVRRETGLETEEDYNRWRTLIGLLIVIALLASPFWTGSWWTFLLGLVMGALWLDDWRSGKKSSAG
jgi:hypothetical protein